MHNTSEAAKEEQQQQPIADDKGNQTKELTKEQLAAVKNMTEEDPDKTSDDIGDISISKFSDLTNITLAQNNITKMMNDTHQYYNSTFIIDADICKKYWVDMDNHPDLKVNHLLSQSHRRAAVRLACILLHLQSAFRAVAANNQLQCTNVESMMRHVLVHNDIIGNN
jgi:hypothetical protein